MPAVAHQSGRRLSLQCRCSRCTVCRWTPATLQARGVSEQWHSQSSYVNEPIIRKPRLESEESQRPSQHLLPGKSSFPPGCSIILRSGRTRGSAVTAHPLCGSLPVEHGSRIRTRPVDEDYTAHATSRLLLGLSAPNSRVGGPKYWSHEYDLSSVQAHGDNSAPVASAFAASSSAKRASAYMALRLTQRTGPWRHVRPSRLGPACQLLGVLVLFVASCICLVWMVHTRLSATKHLPNIFMPRFSLMGSSTLELAACPSINLMI